jgi:hypothetical protein
MQLAQNTSPGFPANPEAPQSAPPMPSEMMPPSPEQGMMNGIETARTETLQ